MSESTMAWAGRHTAARCTPRRTPGRMAVAPPTQYSVKASSRLQAQNGFVQKFTVKPPLRAPAEKKAKRSRHRICFCKSQPFTELDFFVRISIPLSSVSLLIAFRNLRGPRPLPVTRDRTAAGGQSAQLEAHYALGGHRTPQLLAP